ncbi:PAS domain-containing protein [Rhodobacter sp. 24-YEA-8]|uniref:PAS domain-containing protein n=1 Tax=Rhodobacter sp. 24-YEA-8 TaxID=1884310 RepID=UPI00089BA3AF|nr:PAS domain-containing protein [Rhodobacter sp. 24-YEA-8]SEB53975.1 aerotaxis receptor [Rhodobacter sp. 24-YEA-8]
MTRPTELTDNCEAEFAFSELIYSRTCPRGLIRSGNSVFRRMAGIPWADLIGAPHRVIRHPDMPKGFFYLFWQMLKAGEPAVGYVKNRKADGGYYWVLAAAMPCEGGFFSVRLRPSSPIFEKTRSEYAGLREREQSEGLTPEASSQILLARLAELGFPSYDAFAAQALATEIRSRDMQLKRPVDRSTETLASLLSLLVETLSEQARLVSQFSDLVLLPVNMRLVAARLEPQGGPISQISVNYKNSSEEISRRLSEFVSGKGNLCGQMASAVRRSLILAGTSRLQGELVEIYNNGERVEREKDGEERRVEGKVLEGVIRDSRTSAQVSLKEAGKLAGILNEASMDLRRMILGLDTIRILARVESRKTQDSQTALTATIDRIDEVQASVSESLKALMDRSAAIDQALTLLRAPERSKTLAAS